MSSAARTLHHRAILMMIGAVFCFSMMDACVKAVAPEIGVLPALWARYAGQMSVVTLLVLPRLRSVVRSAYPRLQLARSLLLTLATFFFFTGISRTGLAEATAVMALNPLFMTVGAALFLGETLGHRRLTAVGLALLGALLVIRPGFGTFEPDALWPLIAALCFAGYALITRRVGPGEDVWTSLFYTGLIGGAALSFAAPAFWVWPETQSTAALLLAIACIGTTGQLLLIRALSTAEAGMLAPYAYAGLIFAVGFGWIFFDEIPPLLTLIGALVIAGAGIYVWAREARRI